MCKGHKILLTTWRDETVIVKNDDVVSALATAAGIIEDLKNPSIYNNTDNIPKILRREGVSDIMKLSKMFK
ncbi:hypothetical protein [Hafnia paralvei]|uniref:Uncharacterized protein n=1 Tax=Hafnia paralvei TaxID=546367 RepID=A0A4Q9EM86_9GAMM|nr:hypothetical protein [Hafnia paralvei]TBM26670.1 hypothetical protein EYY89_10755 [Hafnia paralvei]